VLTAQEHHRTRRWEGSSSRGKGIIVQSTLDLSEFDELVDELDTQISRLDLEPSAATLSVVCSLGCSGGCGISDWR
jgi:hypothetical protein